ncbi:type VI secretion system-associated protein TagF [Roseibium denhamense]|uniref:Type VI secretion-associated protein, BMA_A0400 family n=1 Tax=Roseibium denhamense TaxID=76305 RepID=A0ABY1NW88_9HYPH|nr:type VI secretion system-associated protein TagF [Roseibium denhamense]MTI04860.1 type VI secretion system-associated protein TagF [Roseibium denhamense]SMP20004.1 type VI secretion-associated protein, BMA_A0400 family [Roseibium denhamense]
MTICGYFGKRPIERDFVYDGLPARVTDAWAGAVSSWLTGCRDFDPQTWHGAYYSAPVWRFAIPKGHLSDRAWLGMLAASADEMGRAFPLVILMDADCPAFSNDVLFHVDEVMDRLELSLLAFVAGETTRREFQNRIVAAAASIRAALQEDIPQISVTFPDLAKDETALCMPWAHLIAPNEHPEEVLIYKEAHGEKGPGQPGFWWHEGSPDRVSEYCVFSRMPAAPAAIGMFMGQWQSFGWKSRENG